MSHNTADQRFTGALETEGVDDADLVTAWERIAIGKLLITTSADQLIDKLSPDHFLTGAHAYIYATAQAHADNTVDQTALLEDLIGQPALRSIPDIATYLSNCRVAAIEAVGDFGWYATQVRDAFRKRTAWKSVERARNALRCGNLPVLAQTFRDGADALAAMDDEPADDVNKFPEIDWDEAFSRDFTQMDWLAGQLMERGQQITIVGDGKVGKSLFTLDWIVRAITGRSFLGDERRDPIKVLYFDRENSLRDIITRLKALGVTPADLKGRLSYRQFPSFSGALDQSQRASDEFLRVVDADPSDVVVLDTASRFIGGKENESDTWLQLYQLIHAPLKARGIGGVRLDHFGKDSDRGSRGSSAKTQDVDHVWEMRRVDERKQLLGEIERISTTITLRRTHTRSGLGSDEYTVVRRGERVRGGMWRDGGTGHELAAAGALEVIRGEVDRIVDDLLAASVPPGLGRDKLKSWMTLKQIPTVKNDLMADVVRELKVRQGVKP
jgi:hypothetical protein